MSNARLAALYARIPKVEGCKRDCSDCCGPVPMLDVEAGAIPHMLRPDDFAFVGLKITPTNYCFDCAYSTPDGCAIYDHRPFMCRLFGAVADEPSLTCPHGAKAKRPLSKEQARQLAAEYRALKASEYPSHARGREDESAAE